MKQTFKFAKYILVIVMVGLMLGAGFPAAQWVSEMLKAGCETTCA